jgi:hypothetical protein
MKVRRKRVRSRAIQVPGWEDYASGGGSGSRNRSVRFFFVCALSERIESGSTSWGWKAGEYAGNTGGQVRGCDSWWEGTML